MHEKVRNFIRYLRFLDILAILSDSVFLVLKKIIIKRSGYCFKVSLERGGGVLWHTIGVGVRGILSEEKNHFKAHLFGFWWGFALMTYVLDILGLISFHYPGNQLFT